jgi:hypothetical protein
LVWLRKSWKGISTIKRSTYNETKLLYLSKKPSWYGSINIIVNIVKTTNTDINLLLKKTLGKFKNNVNIFLKIIIYHRMEKTNYQFSDSKLKIYNICKNNFGLVNISS